jgi:hypothetical protein
VIRSVRFLFLILILAALFGACGENERVRRVTRVEYLPLPKNAPVTIVLRDAPPATTPKGGNQVYDRIAIVDSPHYAIPDYYPRSRNAIEKARHQAAVEKHEKVFEKMRDDLRAMARELGGDCVQDVRRMRVRVRGTQADQNAPLPGLKTQGYHDEYFLRGEVIKLAPRKGQAAAQEALQPAPAQADDAATSATAAPVLPTAPDLQDEEKAEAADENAAPETPADAPQEETPPPGQDSQSEKREESPQP